LETAKRTIAAV